MNILKVLKFGIALISVLFFLCLSSCINSQIYKYDVLDYKATFSLSNNSSDVDVILDITYNIGDQYKSDGFKFVADNQVQDLVCYSDSGERLKTEIFYLRENKLVWYFPAVKNTLKKVKVSFKLKNQLRNIGDKYSLNIPWVGVFRIPIKKAVYEVVLPTNIDPKDLIFKPIVFDKYYENGRCHIFVVQTPLIHKELYIEYKE